MGKLRVKLKQHTPLIHFQAEQDGATLRATELKPKLDRFLLEYAFDYDVEEYKKFLIGDPKQYKKYSKDIDDFEESDKKKPAFDYKVKVTSYKKNIKPINRFPLFFANMGATTKKNFVFCDTVILEFFSYYPELLEKIKHNLADFFICNNFGMRQSKGFGSFYIHPDDELYEEKKLKYCFCVEIKKDELKDKVLFEYIELFYNSLRRGLNYNKVDPVIKMFCDKKGIKWDKEIINKRYFSKGCNLPKDLFLVKDLFGLSVLEMWKNSGPGNNTIRKEHETIKRFKSPIFFKPIELFHKCNAESVKFVVYFQSNEINEEFQKAEFKITKNNKGNLKLKVWEDFSFDDFFNYLFTMKEEIKNQLKKDCNQKDAKKLEEIYDSLTITDTGGDKDV